MSKRIFLIAVFLFSGFIFAQKYGDVIVPGKGIGKIQLGMKVYDVIKILGDKFTENDYESLKSSYGDDLLVRVMLNEPLNRILDYQSTAKKDEHYPIFRLYFKDNILVFISLTSYSKEQDLIKKYGIMNKIFLLGKSDKAKKYFGDDYISESGDITYLEQGICFVTKDEEIRAIHLFPPLKCEEVNYFVKDYLRKLLSGKED